MEGDLLTLKKELQHIKFDTDGWVKKLLSDISYLQKYPKVIEENVDSIQHNYELIQELHDEVTRYREFVAVMCKLLILYEQERRETNKRLVNHLKEKNGNTENTIP